jgi:hypothetical protein
LVDEEVSRIRQRMDKLFYHEEMMWLQRSRIAWLKEGDQNTKYFHRKVVGREKKNKMKLLKNMMGKSPEAGRRWSPWQQISLRIYTWQIPI